MIEFKNSPISFISKIISEFGEIPESSSLFFSAKFLPDADKTFPEEIEKSLELTVDYSFDYNSMKFKFQYYQGTLKDILIGMSKLFVEENCTGIYLNVKNYLSLDPVTDWLKELNKFWVLEPKEAIVYQESGMTLGFKITSDLDFIFFALDEIRAREIMDLLEKESLFTKTN
jgi:hypothetical protein